MPIDPKTGCWFPPICKRQAELLALKGYNIIDVEGPRKSAKTVGCIHKIVQHAWDTNGGRVCMLGNTLANNNDGGAWQDMVETVLPQWIEGGFGMEWVTLPKISSLTHKMFCEITNVHGGTSGFYLESLRDERKAERTFKNRRFSCVYMTEASNFKYRATFDVMLETLRMLGLPEEQHLFLIDTNPAEEGEEHWVYKLFHTFRSMKPSELREIFGDDETKFNSMLAFQKRLAMFRFSLEDNTWLTESQRQNQMAKFAHDKDAYDRHALGLWKKTSLGAVFSKVWRPEFHVKGQQKSNYDPNPQILLPEEGCSELLCGWDVGTINNAVVFAEKCLVETGEGTKPAFKVLDEYVLLDTPLKVEDLVGEVMEIMDFWETQIGRKVIWKHWSDRSSFDRYDNISDSYEFKEIYRASDGEIELMAAAKSGGSVEQRVGLITKLLHQGRLFISARCECVIQSFALLRRNARGRVPTADKHKHPFDALSYPISMEAWAEIEMSMMLKVAKPGGNRLVHTSV